MPVMPATVGSVSKRTVGQVTPGKSETYLKNNQSKKG
jgi:hypothetical protein